MVSNGQTLFGPAEDLSPAPLDRPLEVTVRELVALGVLEAEARNYGRRQAFAVLKSLRRRKPKNGPPVRDDGPTPPTPVRPAASVPLLRADVAGWDALLADPDLTTERLAWVVSVGVMDLPRERLEELARECRDRLRDRVEEAE